MISESTGDYRFLSNFWPCDIKLGYEIYPSVEHAYQALKTTDSGYRDKIRAATTPGKAKRLGRTVPLRPDWEQKKLGVMRGLLHIKFKAPVLREALLKTYPQTLVKGNTWNDTFWGVCNGVGQNHLGKLLMQLRKELYS